MDEEDFFQIKDREQKIQRKKEEILNQQEEEERHLPKKSIKPPVQEKQSVLSQHKESQGGPQSDVLSQSAMDDKKSQSRMSQVKQGTSKKKPKQDIKLISNPELLVEKSIGKPYFLVPDIVQTNQKVKQKINIKYKKKDQNPESEENKVRRWEVYISEIKLENLQKEDLTVFLNFRLGEITNSKQRFEDVSSDEVFFKSEIVKDVKRSEVKSVRVVFMTEMNLSYQMLKDRYFVIEVWQYRRFLLNLFLGKVRLPLIQIANGPIARSENIKKATGEKRQFARIYYKMLFQEVWDYKLTFEAWKASNIMGEGGLTFDPKIEITLLNDDQDSVESEVIKKTQNPNFKDLKGFIHYRGSLESLTDQMLLITIYKDKYFEFCKQLVSLRGVQDTNYIKSQFRLKLKKPPKPPHALPTKKKEDVKPKFDEENEEHEDDDDILQDRSIYCVVEGRMNLNRQPRFMQVGEINRYTPGSYYLVVTINRLEKVLSPDDRGVINSYCLVSWRDQAKATQVMKDNSNPTFNEELYFKMPLIKPELTFQDILQNRSVEDLMVDQIREELRNRPDINFQLWLDGADVLSDESLGFFRVFISEIQKANKQPKQIVTEDNIKITVETRVQSFKKKFTSGLFNITPITAHFQACFIPDLPDSIDLSDFSSIPPDFYPLAISEQMENTQDWRNQNRVYKDWENQIRNNFQGFSGLEKNAYNLFFNSIFVKDQYDNVHLVCKYLEKFYVRYRSQEATAQLFANPKDISLDTLHELVHYVRNIPFINDQFSKREVWMSPEFLLKLRKGFPHDHAILAACLFLGCEIEDNQYKSNKYYIPLEHRTFVCLGTLKLNNEPHAWVLTYSWNLDRVIFWDIMDNLRFELMGRVFKKERKPLRKFIYPEMKVAKPEKTFFSTKKVNKKELRERKRQQRRQQKEQERLDNLKKEQQRIEMERKAEEQDRGQARKYAKFEPDSQEERDDEQIKFNDIVMKSNKLKKSVKNPLTVSKFSQKEQQKQSQIQKKVFQNPFKQHKEEKKNPLQNREAEQELNRQLLDDAKFTQIARFEDDAGNKIVDDFELPYATIDIIFNQKNVFGNLANQDPSEIMYHLHDKKTWLPYILYENTEKKNSDDDDDDDDDEDEEEEEKEDIDIDDDLDTIEIKEAWKEKIGAFYSAQILSEPIGKQKVETILKDIYFEIKGGIVKARGKAGLSTKFKHQEDALNKKMLELIKILEYRDTNRPIKVVLKSLVPGDQPGDPEKLTEREEESKDYDMILTEWRKEVKKLIPVNYKLEALPIRFTFTQSEKMRTIILENMSSFFMVEHKKVIFNLIGRIFNYPNKINCVRLILGYTYSLMQEAVDLSGSDDGDEFTEPQQIKEKEILPEIDEEEEQEYNPLIEN